MKRHGRTVRAFTMLELLLALAIAAMLSLALYKSMTVCLRARSTAQRAVQPVRAATCAIELISRDLESVLAPTGLLAGAFEGMAQQGPTGSADYLDFYSLGSEGDNPRVPMRDGIRHVGLFLRTDVTPPVLVRQVDWNLLPRVQTDPIEEVLCRGVHSFQVLYYDGEYWQQDWDSTSLGNVLPFAVQIELEMETGDIDPMSGQALTQRVIRIIPLACAKLAEETETDTDSSGTGSTSGTGGTSGAAGGGGTGGGGSSGGGRS